MMQRRTNTVARESSKYAPVDAQRCWTNRLISTNPLAAVLTYDAPAEANEAYDFWERASLMRLLGRPIKNKTALDIGCGTGRIALTLAKKGATVTALDVSSAMLEFCRKEARKARVVSRIRGIRASAHEIPCADRQFDIVICFGILEHLPELVRRECIAEAARVLKQGGRM
ncbi:MAG: class I SAM-dependent methyltransferase, partial [Candidatus Zixiibacteriota bacterium]